MSYNHGREFKKFQAHQRRLRRQYEQLGMPESDIEALYQGDLQEFNDDRRHEEHNPIRLDVCEPLVAPEGGGHSRLWWVEEISNPALVGRLKSLSEADLELLTLFVFDGFGQVEIAQRLGVSQVAVSKKITRLKIFLNIFERRL